MQPLLKELVAKCHRDFTENKNYAELAEVLSDDLQILKICFNFFKADNGNRQAPPLTEPQSNQFDALGGLDKFPRVYRQCKDQDIEYQRGQKEKLRSNVREEDQELENLHVEKDEAESKIRQEKKKT